MPAKKSKTTSEFVTLSLKIVVPQEQAEAVANDLENKGIGLPGAVLPVFQRPATLEEMTHALRKLMSAPKLTDPHLDRAEVPEKAEEVERYPSQFEGAVEPAVEAVEKAASYKTAEYTEEPAVEAVEKAVFYETAEYKVEPEAEEPEEDIIHTAF